MRIGRRASGRPTPSSSPGSTCCRCVREQWTHAAHARPCTTGLSCSPPSSLPGSQVCWRLPACSQYAIDSAATGDYSELEQLMEVLQRPYDEQPDADPKYSAPPPAEMVRPGVCYLSCSS